MLNHFWYMLVELQTSVPATYLECCINTVKRYNPEMNGSETCANN